MFVNDRWITQSDELSKYQQALAKSDVTEDALNEKISALLFMIVLVLTWPGGFAVWPLLLIVLADSNAPLLAYPLTFVSVIVLAILSVAFVTGVGNFQLKQVNLFRKERAHSSANGSLLKRLLSAVGEDRELLNRHSDLVDEYLQNTDNVRATELLKQGNLSDEGWRSANKALDLKAKEVAATLRELDEPYQQALRAAKAEREAVSAEKAAIKSLEDGADQRVADEEIMFLLGRS